MPSPPDCDRNATLPGRRRRRRERRVQADRRVGVRDAQAVRPDDTHAVRPRARDDRALERRAVVAHLGESRRQDHERVHLLARALVDDAEHLGRRPHDDGEVDRTGNVEHRRVRGETRRPTPRSG